MSLAASGEAGVCRLAATGVLLMQGRHLLDADPSPFGPVAVLRSGPQNAILRVLGALALLRSPIPRNGMWIIPGLAGGLKAVNSSRSKGKRLWYPPMIQQQSVVGSGRRPGCEELLATRQRQGIRGSKRHVRPYHQGCRAVERLSSAGFGRLRLRLRNNRLGCPRYRPARAPPDQPRGTDWQVSIIVCGMSPVADSQ